MANDNNDSLSRIVAVLRDEDDFLISTHMYPDGDAVSSELAMFHTLRKLGKRSTIVNHSPIGDQYDFLPTVDMIQALPTYEGNGSFDTLISLDCGRDYRLGEVPARFSPRRVINIDHHISNNHFGEINLVEPKASSTGELILDLAVACGVEIDLDIATCVYTAMLSDTGRFCYSNTSPRTHEIAARMISLGVDPARISRRLFRSYGLGQLRLNALLIDTLEVSAGGRVAWALLTHEMCEGSGVTMIETLDAVTIPISLRGVELGLLFRETEADDQVKLSLRSEGEVDVATLAKQFGGGGHPCASGATIEGTMDEVVARVMEVVLAEVNGGS